MECIGSRGGTTGRRLCALCVVLLALGSCYLLPREEKVLAPPLAKAPVANYNVIVAAKSSIESRVAVSASFELAGETSLYFRPPGGRLAKIDVKLNDMVKAGTLIAELDTGNLESRIARQKLIVRKAELASQRTDQLGHDRFEREMAVIDVQLARIDLDDLQKEMEQSRLFATTDGMVVYLRHLQEGDPVDGFSTMARIADPRNLVLFYRGSDASAFRAGMKVSVGVGRGTYSGSVIQAPGSAPATDLPEELQDAVIVSVAGLPRETSRGDSATVTHVTEHRDNVIVLPRDVVHTYQGRNYVQVLDGGLRKERTVELGVATATEIEIVNGLKVGDKVIYQ